VSPDSDEEDDDDLVPSDPIESKALADLEGEIPPGGYVPARFEAPDPTGARPVRREVADDIFRETDTNLLFLLQRLPLAERLDEEWQRYVTRSPDVRVRNDLVHLLILDALRMTVIDLASFCKWMRSKEGFFAKLLKHRDEFRPPLGPSRAREIWDELFPGGDFARRDGPIRRESQRFHEKMKPLVRDRNSGFKAHRFEQYNVADHALKLAQIRTHVSVITEMLNRYKLVLTDTSMLYDLRPLANTEGTAEDLMDILVHGSIDGAVHEFGMVPTRATWFDYRHAAFYWARRRAWLEGGAPPAASPPDLLFSADGKQLRPSRLKRAVWRVLRPMRSMIRAMRR
jgi:hypothetical protein